MLIRRIQQGFTLLELVVVLGVLVALASILVPLVGDIQSTSAGQGATVSLGEIRQAILGQAGRPGYRCDCRDLPQSLADLLEKPADVAAFDRRTASGWRGPYIYGATVTYQVDPAGGFTADYASAGQPVPADPWGRPIVIQYPSAAALAGQDDPAAAGREFCRLVSAGPDGVLQTSPDRLDPTPADRGDDLLVFLLRPDGCP